MVLLIDRRSMPDVCIGHVGFVGCIGGRIACTLSARLFLSKCAEYDGQVVLDLQHIAFMLRRNRVWSIHCFIPPVCIARLAYSLYCRRSDASRLRMRPDAEGAVVTVCWCTFRFVVVIIISPSFLHHHGLLINSKELYMRSPLRRRDIARATYPDKHFIS